MLLDVPVPEDHASPGPAGLLWKIYTEHLERSRLEARTLRVCLLTARIITIDSVCLGIPRLMGSGLEVAFWRHKLVASNSWFHRELAVTRSDLPKSGKKGPWEKVPWVEHP